MSDEQRFNQNVKDLVREVKAMRGLQKRYFATRDGDVLKEAKAVESRVDRMLEELFGEPRLW